MKRTILWICLLLGGLGLTACQDLVDDLWEDKEPITERIETSKDWKKITADIVPASATTAERKVAAIYDYICSHVEYDTSYAISTADEGWDKKKGVCQAYAEMFCLMARSVDVDARLVRGSTKTGRHAWAAVFYDGQWHLMDPCWGAGFVNDEVFSYRSNHRDWYDVDPYWMLLTHYPDNYDEWAMVDSPMTLEHWRHLPEMHKFAYLELPGRDILHGLLDQSLRTLPSLYYVEGLECRLLEAPLDGAMQVGQEYTVRYRPFGPQTCGINGNAKVQTSTLADGTQLITFKPMAAGRLKVYADLGDDVRWTILAYDVTDKADTPRSVVTAPETSGFSPWKASERCE